MPAFPRPALPTSARAVLIGALLAVAGAAWLPATAVASHTQIAMIQDGHDLLNPAATLLQFRALGANTVRVIVPWATIAPDPKRTRRPSFDATNPNSYPAGNWLPYDEIVEDAKQDGLTVDFTVTGGAPRWAEGPGIPTAKGSFAGNLYFAWKPNAGDYGQFMRAIGERYDGTFVPKGANAPLPDVSFWAIWNEVNFGEDLGPQAIDGSKVSYAPRMYRALLNAGWSALHATGHGKDTILIDEFAARGIQGGVTKRAPQGYPGNAGQTKPLLYLRTLYCVNLRFQELRGSAAASVGCPTTAAGSARFRAENPALFEATGVGDHPYPGNQNPLTDGTQDPNFAAFPDLGHLESILDRLNRTYGSKEQFPIYNDEYGYITDPPNNGKVAITGGHYVTPAIAAYYMNWAEYLSWKEPRVASYMQYLLEDPPSATGPYSGFASGLETQSGAPKATYAAYRLPVYMPQASFPPGASVEVWGDARPAPFMALDGDGPQMVSIQLNDHTINQVPISGTEGYFDIHMTFPQSGNVRLAWTYPATDPFLPISLEGTTVYSRTFPIVVR
jgi:hypothetical protein